MVYIKGKVLFHKNLTGREKECLLLAPKGFSAPQTADVLKLGITTINTHRTNLKCKLDCETMSQAVYEGIRYGYVKQEEKNNV